MTRALACVFVLSLLAFAAPGGAQEIPAKGQRALPPTSAAADCKLRPSGHKSLRNEWASCISVTANLSRAPAVGETAVLTFQVTADVRRDRARVVVKLPSNLEFVDAAGATLGADSNAVQTRDLAADRPQTTQMVVRAVAPGPAEIMVTSTAPNGRNVDGGYDSVFLTVGSSSESSRFGFATPTRGGVTRAVGTPARAAASGGGKTVPTTGLPKPHSDDPEPPVSTLATSCASGSWHFLDQNGALQPSVNYQVQVWDSDSGADDLLATGVTSFSGSYNLCFGGADGEGGGQEVYVKFISANSLWRVRNTPGGNSDYVNQTGVQPICDGCNASFGAVMPGNDIHRGMHAFDAANDAWVWVPSTCWDGLESSCRQVVINWTGTSTDGTFYSLAGNDVHLAAADPDAATVVIHEVGHAIMDDVYEDDYPPIPSCNPHGVQTPSSTGCAWTEGFAEWFPASVLNDPFFRWPDGSFLDLENATWGSSGWSNGDTVEGRVAGALIDISDFTNEAYWDRHGEGDPGNIWTTFLNNVSDTTAQFWLQRAAGGFNTANSGANGSVYQNTIDYTFRDPLGDYVELNRPTPTPHNYSYNTSSVYWSVFAVRPPSGIDYDLTLYDDVGQTVNLGGSAFGGSTTDFVAVDSNHRPRGDYYPRAYQFSGTGNYQVELAQGSNQLNLGSQTVFMGPGDVVLVRDSSQNPGAPTFFRVTPSSAGQDSELFLMQSDGANSATWVRSRGSAVASSTANGPGAAEGFSYTPPAADWYGLVLINKAGSGNYNLHVDTSAPTGSVQIDGGATHTADTSVSLTLSAADDQTGVEQMRISTDGVFNDEPWVPYAASADVTLPGGDGLKTVSVLYRNFAGIESAVASDDITLDTTTCRGQTTTIIGSPGSEVINGTSGPDVIRALEGNDTIIGMAGDDTICGGPGNDVIEGRGGNDDILGGSGDDTVSGNLGNDRLDGGEGVNRASFANSATAVTANIAAGTATGEGTDQLFFIQNLTGSGQNDVLTGSPEANGLAGGPGADRLFGGAGGDILTGGNGNDDLTGGPGADEYRGGSGVNRANFSDAAAGVTASIPAGTATGEGSDILTLIQNLTGSRFADILTGDGVANQITAGRGNDRLFGRGGNDNLRGGLGNDDIDGGGGTDTCLQEGGTGTITNCP